MSTTNALEGFEFPVADREKWLSLVEGAKGGVQSADELVTLTDDGIAIDPLMPRSADAALLPRRQPDLPWVVVQRADDPDPARANAQARADLEQGATYTVTVDGSGTTVTAGEAPAGGRGPMGG